MDTVDSAIEKRTACHNSYEAGSNKLQALDNGTASESLEEYLVLFEDWYDTADEGFSKFIDINRTEWNLVIGEGLVKVWGTRVLAFIGTVITGLIVFSLRDKF